MLGRKVLKVRASGHSAIGVHNLTDHRGRIEPCQTGQVDRSLSLSRPLQDATRTRSQWKYMPRTGEIFRTTIQGLQNRTGSICRGNASSNAFTCIDRYGKSRPTLGRIVCHHERECKLIEMLGEHRHTNQATAKACHEGNRLGRDFLRPNAEISFSLTFFVITQDDHATFADLGQHVRNGGKRHWCALLKEKMLSQLPPGLCTSIDHCPGHAGEQGLDQPLYTVPWATGQRCQVTVLG